MLTCVQVRELASELALGVLTGAERAEAIVHVNECARCRALLNELSAAADVLPLLVPEREPPPGFEKAVLDHMHARRSRRVWLRRAGGAAVVAAAACIVTLVVVRVVDRDRSAEAPPDAAAAPSEVAAAPMIGAGNQIVGQVFATSGDRPWAYAFVEYQSIPDGSYRVTVRDGDGAAPVGEMQVDGGRGFWGGPIETPGPGTTISLVSIDGATVCKARFA